VTIAGLAHKSDEAISLRNTTDQTPAGTARRPSGGAHGLHGAYMMLIRPFKPRDDRDYCRPFRKISGDSSTTYLGSRQWQIFGRRVHGMLILAFNLAIDMQ
jgi:hypothetical protein